MFDKTVTALSAALRRKEISSVELTGAFLERINKYKELNAFITVEPERSLARLGPPMPGSRRARPAR